MFAREHESGYCPTMRPFATVFLVLVLLALATPAQALTYAEWSHFPEIWKEGFVYGYTF